MAKALELHDYGPDNPWGHWCKWGMEYLAKDGINVFAAQKMSEQKSARELQLMRAVLATLKELREDERIR